MTMRNLSGLMPGSILLEDVVTDKGTKLFPKGIKITERHIEIMKRWGVTEVPVGESNIINTTNSQGDDKETENEKMKMKIEELFSTYDAVDIINEIIRVASKLGINNEYELEKLEPFED